VGWFDERCWAVLRGGGGRGEGDEKKHLCYMDGSTQLGMLLGGWVGWGHDVMPWSCLSGFTFVFACCVGMDGWMGFGFGSFTLLTLLVEVCEGWMICMNG
jgi:hypothetical protein